MLAVQCTCTMWKCAMKSEFHRLPFFCCRWHLSWYKKIMQHILIVPLFFTAITTKCKDWRNWRYRKQFRTSNERSRRRPAFDMTKKQVAITFQHLTSALEKRKRNEDLGKRRWMRFIWETVSQKLCDPQKYNRQIIMYEIDGLYINTINRNSFVHATPSPQYYSRPQSVPNVVHVRR